MIAARLMQTIIFARVPFKKMDQILMHVLLQKLFFRIVRSSSCELGFERAWCSGLGGK